VLIINLEWLKFIYIFSKLCKHKDKLFKINSNLNSDLKSETVDILKRVQRVMRNNMVSPN
jgi:hypothetical protein